MDEALRSAGWICIAVVLGAYLTFVSADRVFNTRVATSTPIVVRDVLRKGEHHLYGKMEVPSPCDEVRVHTENISENEYELSFTTWAEPAVKCTNEPSERVFDTIVFAPSIGVKFTATIDKVPVPVLVFPVLYGQ